MIISLDIVGYMLLGFGLLAAVASLYRFTRCKSPLENIPDTVQLASDEPAITVFRQIIVIKKFEFYSLMLLVFTILLFYYLTEAMPSAVTDNFFEISIKMLQIYGFFAGLMIPVRWWLKKKIRNLCLNNSKRCEDSTILLLHYIESRDDISFFWRNQAVKFIQNRIF